MTVRLKADGGTMFSGGFDFNGILKEIIIILIAITWHELAHALTANYLGDDTPRRMGHFSLNPFRHMDQTGALLLFLSAISFNGAGAFAFGFTPVNERNMRPNPKTGGGIVAVAGPISNVVLAALIAIPLDFLTLDPTSAVFDFLTRALYLNLFLAVFNIIPIPPLDGWRVLETFLSPRTLYDLRAVKQYGPLILLALFLFGSQLHFFDYINATFVQPLAHLLAPNIFA